MSDSPKHVTVRLRVPPELRDMISASSEQYNRSMNADMVARLEESFEKEDAAEFDKEFVLQVIKNQQDQIDQLQNMVKQLVVRPREMGE